jgi:predicted nuclease of predicted toxin-antitoxin system
MKFLIDAQLPSELERILKEFECDCIHVDSLPLRDKTSDSEIRKIADQQERIVITKDFDFYYTHMANGSPKQLLIITTGNIKNRTLFDLFRNNFKEIQIAFKGCRLVELSNTEVIGIE